MPVEDPNLTGRQFYDDFLSNNGLGLLVQIFQVDYFPVDTEYEVRQACYSLALQLVS